MSPELCWKRRRPERIGTVGVYDYTVEDLSKDMATLDRLLAKKTR